MLKNFQLVIGFVINRRCLSFWPDWRCFLSAFLIVLALPPFGLSPLIWIALLPWFSALESANTLKEAFLKGLWLSFFCTFMCYYWLAYALHGFGTLPWVLSGAILLLYCWMGQPQFLIFALIRHAFPIRKAKGWCAPLLSFTLGLAYVGIDWLIPKLLVDTLGYSLYQSKYLSQVADISGVMGLTFLIYLVNDVLWALFHRLCTRQGPSTWPVWKESAPQLTLAIILVAAAMTYGEARIHFIQEILSQSHPVLQTSIIQPNIIGFEKLAAEQGIREASSKVMNTLFTLSNAALKLHPQSDVLIWPETAYPSFFRSPRNELELERDQSVERFVRTSGVSLFFGGYDKVGGKNYNSFFFLTPKAHPEVAGLGDLQVYHKSILMPFGEFIPGTPFIPAIKKAFPQVGNFARGWGSEVFKLFTEQPEPRTGLTSPIICYEVLFPNYVLNAVRRGSQFILNITNDSWFGPYGQQHLHLAVSTFRSIETRRPQLLASNNGFSCLIGPDGVITSQSSLNTPEIIPVTVPLLPPIPTVMLIWGDWLGPTALVLSFLLMLVFFRKRKVGLLAQGRVIESIRSHKNSN